MSSEQAMAILLRGKLESMKEVQDLLRRRGITSEIRRPSGEGCDTG